MPENERNGSIGKGTVESGLVGGEPIDESTMNNADELLATLLQQFDDAAVRGEHSGTPPPDLPPDLEDRFQGATRCLQALDAACRLGFIAEDDFVAATPFSGDFEIEDADQDRPLRIGRFEILRELGRGGYGVVFLAFDPQIQRQVALKVPRPEVLVSGDLRRRFLREAQAAGNLDHPNLIGVYEAGEFGPICYIASAFCDGPTLRDWLQQQPETISPKLAARLIAELADGVEHAHRRGVLHRDIKPSNVLLAPLGASDSVLDDDSLPFSPKLTDFGLAKLRDQTGDGTRSGLLLGTPAYMAPEQASGRLQDSGPQTDVYGLGVLLYEMLTGKPPFRGLSDADTIRQVVCDEPIRPGKLRPRMSRDLEAICLTCLEKKPTARYQSASDLAADLRRFLRGEATLARPLSAAAQVLKWSRRRPATASLVVVSLLALVTLSMGGWYSSARIRSALSIAEDRRGEAEESAASAQGSELKMRRLLYAADLRAAQQAWNEGRWENARDLLKAYIPKAGNDDLREFSWRYLWRLADQNLVTLRGHDGDVYRAIPSPDGKWIATCGRDKTVRLWETATGKQLALFTRHTDEVNLVKFSPNGKWLVSASDDGFVVIYDVASRREIRTLRGDGKAVLAAAFAPDNHILATAGKNCQITIWDTRDWTSKKVLVGHTDFVQCLAFSPDGKLIGSGGEAIRIWDVATGLQIKSFKDSHSDISSVVFTPDGQSIASGCRDHFARIRRLNEDTPQAVFRGHTGAVHQIALAHGGQWLATASQDGKVIIWDTRTQEQKKVFRGHSTRVWSVAFLPGAEAIVTASSDGTAKICKLSDTFTILRDTATGIAPDAYWTTVAFSADGTHFAAAGISDTTAQSRCSLHEVPGFQVVDRPEILTCFRARFACGGELFVGRTAEPVLHFLNLKTGIHGTRSIAPQPNMFLVCQSKGDLVVVGGRYPLQLWNARLQEKAGVLPGDPEIEVYQMALDPTDEWLATAQSDNSIRVWDLAARKPIASVPTTVPASTRIVFAPNRDLLCSGTDGMVHRWNVLEQRQIYEFDAEMSPVLSLAIDPTGRTLALGGEPGLWLWDLETRSKLLKIQEGGVIVDLAFSPDGNFLASGGNISNLLLWRADSFTQIAREQTNLNSSTYWTEPDSHSPTVPPRRKTIPVSLPDDLDDLPSRFRRVSDWSTRHDFRGAFPTYLDQETDHGLRLGGVAIRRLAPLDRPPYHEDVLKTDLADDPPLSGNMLLQRQGFRWSLEHKAGAGIANYHYGGDGGGMFIGLFPLQPSDIEVRLIRIAELGDVSTYEARLRAIQPYAKKLDFVGGFPNYVDGKDSIGVVLLKGSCATAVMIPAEDLR